MAFTPKGDGYGDYCSDGGDHDDCFDGTVDVAVAVAALVVYILVLL